MTHSSTGLRPSHSQLFMFLGVVRRELLGKEFNQHQSGGHSLGLSLPHSESGNRTLRRRRFDLLRSVKKRPKCFKFQRRSPLTRMSLTFRHSTQLRTRSGLTSSGIWATRWRKPYNNRTVITVRGAQPLGDHIGDDRNEVEFRPPLIESPAPVMPSNEGPQGTRFLRGPRWTP